MEWNGWEVFVAANPKRILHAETMFDVDSEAELTFGNRHKKRQSPEAKEGIQGIRVRTVAELFRCPFSLSFDSWISFQRARGRMGT